jgi:hypothetical protein
MATVYVSSVIPAPLNEVWQKIRRFNALPEWHPSVENSVIENGESEDRIGCVRRFTQQGGTVLREQLCALDDIEHSLAYKIIEAPLPLENYLAVMRLFPITHINHTFAAWSASFTCEKSDEQSLVQSLEDVFQAGFSALQKQY